MTSGKPPRRKKPSLPSRTFPRPAKARLRGTPTTESTALAVSRDTEALGYLQALHPQAVQGGLLRLEQAEGASTRLRTKPPAHPACRGPACSLRTQGPSCGNSDPHSAGLFPSGSQPPGPVQSPLQASTCPKLLLQKLTLQAGGKALADCKQKTQTRCSSCY